MARDGERRQKYHGRAAKSSRAEGKAEESSKDEEESKRARAEARAEEQGMDGIGSLQRACI
jgi:hypothetical protein